MPTPFYHLSIAEQLLGHPGLPDNIRTFLAEYRCEFFLGKTAPDVQTITDQGRESTHFYRVWPVDHKIAWERMFRKHPGLKNARALPPAQAAFIAGYICHLQADQDWILGLFHPYFGPAAKWAKIRRRIFLHNVLRTYLDEQIIKALAENISACLGRVRSKDWLPFVKDNDLNRWRDLLAAQLAPGAKSQTAEVFAGRLGVPVKEFVNLVRSESRLDIELFVHVPRSIFEEYRKDLMDHNTELLIAYLGDIDNDK